MDGFVYAPPLVLGPMAVRVNEYNTCHHKKMTFLWGGRNFLAGLVGCVAI
jgi:hypothetical protein